MLVARVLTHTPQAKCRKGIFHGARPKCLPLAGSARLNERSAIGAGVSSPAEANAGGGVPMRRVRTASSIGTSLVVASSLGTRLSPPIQPNTPTILSGKRGDFNFPPNGILLLCVDPLLIPVEVWL